MKNSNHDKPWIKITLNGPYVVTGGIPLSTQSIVVDKEGYSCEWLEGKKYETPSRYSLCRCGNSKNKPFCDGSHIEHRFDGTETASREHYSDRARRIEGPEMLLTDVKELCAGARFCDRAGSIWHLVRQSGDPEAMRIAIEEANNCPSGRLVIWNKNGSAIENNLNQAIALIEDPQRRCLGPIWVQGGIPIESADGRIYEVRNRVTLCRCGMSLNKPFCDASHVRGFTY